MAGKITLGVVLADGSNHSWNVRKLPPKWASWVMQQMPYGTAFQGANFYRERSN